MEENKETKVVNFTTDNGEEIPFFVVEETKIAGENYLLVTDSEEMKRMHIFLERFLKTRKKAFMRCLKMMIK
mgnify:CR=1 FL=1